MSHSSALALLAQDNAGWPWFGPWVSLWAIGVLLVFVFWILMMIDCMNSNLPAREKVVWLLVIFFLPLIGSLIYLFAGRKNDRRGLVM